MNEAKKIEITLQEAEKLVKDLIRLKETEMEFRERTDEALNLLIKKAHQVLWIDIGKLAGIWLLAVLFVGITCYIIMFSWPPIG